jgi:hypothetical protein
MRKWLMLLPVVLTLIGLVGSGVAGAAPNSGADTKGVGGGWTNFLGETRAIHFAFSAHEGPQGDFGQVQFEFTQPSLAPVQATVDLDCVHVFPELVFQNDGAWLSGVVKKASPQPNAYAITPGSRLEFYAEDGGEPSDSGFRPVDTFTVNYEHLSCQTMRMTSDPIRQNVTAGNVVVRIG